MTCPMMMSIGVYILGAASAAERQRLEAHLPGCRQCQTELSRLTPLPGLLARIPESIREPRPSPRRPAEPTVPARQAGPPRLPVPRGSMRRGWSAILVACVAAGVSGGLWLSRGAGGHRAVPLTLTGTNPATHVSATASLTETSWGTSIQLRLRGVPENVECHLVIRSTSGDTEVSGAWDSWQKGGPLSVPASAPWLPSDIASLQVTTPTQTLLTISIHQMAAGAGQ
jgi:hypothetical protein